MKQLLIFCSMLFAISSLAQDIDKQRMKRDVEVAENIISTLLKQEQNSEENSYVFRTDGKVEGNYLEGYGLIFSTAQGSVYAINGYHRGNSKDKSKSEIIVGSGISAYTIRGSKVILDGNAETGKDKKAVVDSLAAVQVQQFKKAAQTFFTDYAYLIGQLQPDEKIMLRNDRYNSHFFGNEFHVAGIRTTSSGNAPAVAAEVNVEDINALRNGKITQEQFIDRIKFTEIMADKTVKPDIKLVASVFDRLYDRDLSQQFTRLGNCNYQRLEGLGAIYHMNFSEEFAFSNLRKHTIIFGDRLENWDDGDVEVIVGDDDEDELEEDEEQSDQEAYDAFITDFKHNMIEYGRMAKSLEADELLIFRLRFNDLDCEDCYENPELSIKAEVLKQFDANAISLDEAVGEIKVTAKQD